MAKSAPCQVTHVQILLKRPVALVHPVVLATGPGLSNDHDKTQGYFTTVLVGN